MVAQSAMSEASVSGVLKCEPRRQEREAQRRQHEKASAMEEEEEGITSQGSSQHIGWAASQSKKTQETDSSPEPAEGRLPCHPLSKSKFVLSQASMALINSYSSGEEFQGSLPTCLNV